MHSTYDGEAATEGRAHYHTAGKPHGLWDQGHTLNLKDSRMAAVDDSQATVNWLGLSELDNHDSASRVQPVSIIHP
jgi:hypothetical protein